MNRLVREAKKDGTVGEAVRLMDGARCKFAQKLMRQWVRQ